MVQATCGELLVRSREGQDWQSGRSGLILMIADTGPGMLKENLARVFDAFYDQRDRRHRAGPLE